MLFSLIESIIDMSRIDGGKLELVTQPASLKEVLNDIIEKWAKEAQAKGVTFTYHIPKICEEDIHIDPPRLSQCVDTLLSNAIKFTDKAVYICMSQPETKLRNCIDILKSLSPTQGKA